MLRNWKILVLILLSIAVVPALVFFRLRVQTSNILPSKSLPGRVISTVTELTTRQKVTINSQISGFSARISDPEILEQHLQKYGFWKDDGIYDPSTGEARTIKKLEIILVREQDLPSISRLQ